MLFLSGKDFFFISIAILMTLSYGVLSVKELFQTVMQKAERMDWFAISKVLKGLLSLLLFSIAIYFTHNLLAGIIALLIARCSILILYDFLAVLYNLRLEVYRAAKPNKANTQGRGVDGRTGSYLVAIRCCWLTMSLLQIF